MERKTIGGSDSAAVLGISKWKTPMQFYLQLLGEWEQEITEEKQALFDIGHAMEPVIRDVLFTKKTGKIVRFDSLQCTGLKHPVHEYITANLDGIVVEHDGTFAVFEAKTADRFTAHMWGVSGTDQVPATYLCQCHHYLMVTGFKRCYLAVLIGGNDFRVYVIEKDHDFESMLMDKYAEFWECVQTRTPPRSICPADNVLKWPQNDAVCVQTSDLISSVIQDARDLKAAIKHLETKLDEKTMQIQNHMQEASAIVDTTGQSMVTWKQQDTRRFDSKTFKQDHPEEYEKYLRVSSSRVLRF